MCDLAITAESPEIDIEMDEPPGVILHPDCYAIWLAEVRSYGS
jgi:hypothetical protein